MIRRILLLVLLLAAAVTAFFVFHHPPMRLMPPPLLFQEGGDAILGARPELVADTRIALFYATNRLPVGPRDDRLYTVAPDRRLHLGTATLRIGDEDDDPRPAPRVDHRRRRLRPPVHPPRAHGRGRHRLAPGDVPRRAPLACLAEIDAALAASRSRDLLVYVHGANTTVERAAGQAAQLHHFAGRDAVVVLFAWPTAENFLRYPRDIAPPSAAPRTSPTSSTCSPRHTARRAHRRLHLQRRRHHRQRRPRARSRATTPPPPPASARSTTPPPTPTSAASSTTSRPTPATPAA